MRRRKRCHRDQAMGGGGGAKDHSTETIVKKSGMLLKNVDFQNVFLRFYNQMIAVKRRIHKPLNLQNVDFTKH